jgi:hypothetical protein
MSDDDLLKLHSIFNDKSQQQKIKDAFNNEVGVLFFLKEFKFEKIRTKIECLKKYKELIYDPWEENLINKALCFYLLDQYPNLMIIPCFPAPLNQTFSLFDISTKEMSVYFPNVAPANVFEKYADLRPGHMTPENNKILAELINKNLTPGIFQTDINLFPTPLGPVEQHFKAIR